MKKILFISTFYPQKSITQYGIFVHEQAKALQEKGYEVDIINPQISIQSNYDWKYEGINIKCIKYLSLPTNYLNIISSYFLYRSLKQLGIEYYQKYDMIHVHNCLPEGNAVRLLAKKIKMPYIVQIHGLDVFHNQYLKNKFAKEIYFNICKKVYNGSSSIVGVSEKVTDEIKVCLKSEDYRKVHVIYNGYNPRIFNCEKKRDGNNEVIKLISIGNLIEIKGFTYLIDAFINSYSKFGCNVELCILGKGPLEEELKQQIKDTCVADKVKFMGYLSVYEVAKNMKEHDVFILPSYYEALGCVYLEAMACGLPVIACKGQGIEEIIENNKNGFLVNIKDSQDISQKMEDLISNGTLRNYISHNAIETMKNYTWARSTLKIASVYHTVGNEVLAK